MTNELIIHLLLRAAVLSLTVTAIYVLFREGMFLGRLKKLGNALIEHLVCSVMGSAAKTYVDRKRWATYIQKPVWGCLSCMASLWTILLTWSFDIKLILVVCGLNAIIGNILSED